MSENNAGEARRQSVLASSLEGSQILQIATEIRELVAHGRTVCNLTVGDFSSAQFPIPDALREGITAALEAGETNYPPSPGMPALRESVSHFYGDWLNLEYPVASVLITAGSRPGIYATFRVIADPGDRIVFAVPSWNNNHYTHMVGGRPVAVETTPETGFLPTRAMLEEPLRGARLLSLNSPLNPTGTCFDADTLGAICDAVLEENERRRVAGERPLYLMYDQVYWMLTFGETRHVNPVGLRPEMRPYTVFIDGISKAFTATGLRVGWVVAPPDLIQNMSDFMGHVGAWAPRPAQLSAARLLRSRETIEQYHETMHAALQRRLDALYQGLVRMREEGLPVDAFPPAGAIYLSARFALSGLTTPAGGVLRTNEDIRKYLLHEAGFAAVPFQAFGVPEDTGWFRLSVGAVSMKQIEEALPRVEEAVKQSVDVTAGRDTWT